MNSYDDSDTSSDWSDTASELEYRAELKRLAEAEAEYYAQEDVAVKLKRREVLRDPNPCHVEWIKAANQQDFSNVTEDTVVGALGFFIRALIVSCRLLSKDDEQPDTREEWKEIMARWLEDQARSMADILGSEIHGELSSALRDPKSGLVTRVRDWINQREFDRIRDLRYNPMSEPATRAGPPMFAQPSLVQVTDERLRGRGAVGLLPRFPTASTISSPTTTIYSIDSACTQRTRIDSDATSAGKSSHTDKRLRRASTPAGASIRVVSLPSTPEDTKAQKIREREQTEDAQEMEIGEKVHGANDHLVAQQKNRGDA